MKGIITRGTTLRGVHVNEGDEVDIGEDDFHKLLSTGDIRAVEVAAEPAPVVEKTSEKVTAKKPAVKKKK